jgi:hypothetical protein
MNTNTNTAPQGALPAPPLTACAPPPAPAGAPGAVPGVNFNARRQAWAAKLRTSEGRTLGLGWHPTQEAAAGAVRAALSLARRDLLSVRVACKFDPVLRARREEELGRVPTGACLHRPSGLWQAKIGYQGRRISLGYFKTAGFEPAVGY